MGRYQRASNHPGTSRDLATSKCSADREASLVRFLESESNITFRSSRNWVFGVIGSIRRLSVAAKVLAEYSPFQAPPQFS
jgi:hypothetical protein